MRYNVLNRLKQSLTPELLMDSVLAKQSSSQKYPWSTSDEFFTSDKYANLKLYPNQRLMLKLWNLELDDLTDYEKQTIDKWRSSFHRKDYTIGIPEDIYERVAYLKQNGFDHFSTIVSILGRRASKSFLSGREMSLVDAQLLWNGIPDVTAPAEASQSDVFYTEDDLADNYTADDQLSADASVYSLVMATTGTQAQETTFTDHYNAVIANKWLNQYLLRATPFGIWFQTVKDRLRTMELLKAGVPLERDLCSIVCRPASSTSTSNRGRAVFSYCVSPDSQLLDLKSKPFAIADAKVGQVIQAFDEQTYERTLARILAIHTDIYKLCYELTFSDNTTIQCSPDHKLVTDKGWLKASDFTVGMHIACNTGWKYLSRIQPMGVRPMMDLTTTSHTYICNGLYSHNCLAPDTLVDMQDNTQKRIIDLHIGDKLKAFDEHDVHKPCTSTVLRKWTSRKPAKRITFTDGTYIIATDEHKFVDANGNWVQTKDLKPGDWLQ